MATTFPVRAETGPAVKDIDQLIAALRKTGKEAGLTEKEIDDLVKKSSDFGKEGTKGVNQINTSMGGLNKTIATVGASLAAMFAFDRIKQFVGSVVSVTSEFQKLEAVLSNTLGSRSAAQAALKDIQNFAAKTPFSVLELTNSFVKLVNQGFKPTNDEMRKLGDIASSTGKQFDQLAEAIIDAQTGEFERLKEFGIRASKEGDKVTFTFKGVQTQTDFTSESIRNYITALGDLEGVSGSMAAISETLGGKISNLGDAYDQLLVNLGNANSGVLFGSLEFLAKMLDVINVSMSDPIADAAIENANEYRAALEGAFKVFQGGGSAEDFNKAIAENVKETNLWRESAELLEKQLSSVDEFLKSGYKAEDIPRLTSQLKVEQQTAVKLAELTQEYLKKIGDTKVATKELSKEELKRLEDLKKTYAELIALAQKYNDEALAAFNRRQVNGKEIMDAIDPTRGVITNDFTNTLDPEKADDLDLKSVEEIEAEKQALKQQTFDVAAGLIKDLAYLSQKSNQEEMDLLQMRYQDEIRMAGDNENAKGKIARDFERKQRELLTKQAQNQQQMAVFNVLSSQAPAIAKTLGEGGAFSLPLALSLIGIFGSLLVSLKAIKPPKFAEGVYGLDGPGTDTSDSIPAWLSRNESVVPADRSKHFKDLLKPMIENDSFRWADVKNIVDARLPGLAGAIIISKGGTDSDEMVQELRATRKAIESKKETRFVFDEKGFSAWVTSGNDSTKYLRKRYSM